MLNELKPCPFCNGEASPNAVMIAQLRVLHVSCIKCLASTDVFFGDQEKQAAASWNMRNAWIPCSERNPEKDGNYLVTERWHPTGYWVGRCAFLHNKWYSSNVIAWQELPEAFKP